MPLINCPECNKEISNKAPACPHCGNPINESIPIVVRKDYKAKAKAFTITGIIITCLSFFINGSVAGDLVAMKAQYLTGGGGAYPIINFVLNASLWLGVILLGIGIIYWIIYANVNKK